jgi:murein DD-endopeptidase MepM/ murein hydrolase activator NlpD
MHSRYNSPMACLTYLCVGCALFLGGVPSSTTDEGRLVTQSHKSQAFAAEATSLSAGMGPVPCQIQVATLAPDSQQIIKSLLGIGTTSPFLPRFISVTQNVLGEALPAVSTPSQSAAKLPVYLVHTVQQGETLWDIAKMYGIDVETLINANTLRSAHQLQVGQKINVITVKGVLYTVRQGETLWDIAKRFNVDIDKIIVTNNITDPAKIQPKQMLVLPGAKINRTTQTTTTSTTKSTSTSSRTLVSSSGRLQKAFSWPVRGRISSRFGQRWGRMHEGLDIAVATGTPVRAVAAGKVTYAGWGGTYGYLVKIDHGQGVETRYAHNSRLLVKVGQTVSEGQVIARSGNTGRSTGPHVHFEIRYKGKAYNPLNYLR